MGSKRQSKTEEAFLLSDVEELKKRRAKEREEHAAKYPECAKLAQEADHKRALLDFVEWLRAEKRIELADSTEMDRSGYLAPIPAGESYLERIVHDYLEIDSDKLEKERRAILRALQEDST